MTAVQKQALLNLRNVSGQWQSTDERIYAVVCATGQTAVAQRTTPAPCPRQKCAPVPEARFTLARSKPAHRRGAGRRRAECFGARGIRVATTSAPAQGESGPARRGSARRGRAAARRLRVETPAVQSLRDTAAAGAGRSSRHRRQPSRPRQRRRRRDSTAHRLRAEAPFALRMRNHRARRRSRSRRAHTRCLRDAEGVRLTPPPGLDAKYRRSQIPNS